VELAANAEDGCAALAGTTEKSQWRCRYGNERARTVGGDRLVERNEDSLAAVRSFFNLGPAASTSAAVAGSAAFSENAKSYAAGVDRSVRSSAHARADAVHGEEINMVVTWAEAVARHRGVPMARLQGATARCDAFGAGRTGLRRARSVAGVQ
jgi:hypothetical protein